MSILNVIPQPPGLPNLPLTYKSPKAPKPPVSTGSPANPDELSELLEFQWRGIGYPTTSFEETGSQSLAVHRYPNLPSARVENTGTDPRTWSAIIPMTNNIFPSTNESWSAGNLFVDALYRLMDDLNDITSGTLQHPVMGSVIAKVHGWNYRLNGDKPRDGVIITVHFIECLDDEITITESNAAISIAQNMLLLGSSLDSSLTASNIDPRLMPPGINLANKFTQLAAYVKQLLAFPNSVTTSINAQLVGVTSTAAGLVNNVVGAPAAAYQTAADAFQLNKNVVLGTLAQIQSNSNNLISTTAAFNTVSGIDAAFPSRTAPINYNGPATARVNTTYQHMFNTYNSGSAQAIAKMVDFTLAVLAYYQSLNNSQVSLIIANLLSFLTSVYALQAQVAAVTNNSPYQTLSLVTQVPMTFMQLAQYTNNTIDQIMQLNPNTSSLIFVPAQTQISYYSATGA